MKRIIYTLAIAFALTSCIIEERIVDIPDDETPVLITLTAGAQNGPDNGNGGNGGNGNGPATRADNAGSAADSHISSLRVLGYRADGSLAFNAPATNLTAVGSGFTGEILVKTGRYSLVFIANETSDPALPAALGNLAPGANYIHKLSDMSFSQEAFRSTKDIPMIARVDNVTITKTADGPPAIGAANGQGTFGVTMLRLGIRLDLTVTLYAAQFDAWYDNATSNAKNVSIRQVPQYVYLFGKDNYFTDGISEFARNIEYTGANPPADANGRKTFTIPRIILPETVFTDAGNANKALRLRLWDGRKFIEGNFSVGGSTTDYTIPRNTFLEVRATASEWDMAMSAAVADWNDAAMNGDATPRWAVTINLPNATQGTAAANHTWATAGETIEILATPAPGQILRHWTTSGVTLADPGANPASFTMPSGDVTLTPVFGERLYKISADKEDGMTITANDPVSEAALNGDGVPAGTQVTLTAACNDASYTLAGWDIYGPTWNHPNSGLDYTGFEWKTTWSVTFVMHPATPTTPGGRKIALWRQRLYKVHFRQGRNPVNLIPNDEISNAALNGAGVPNGTQVSYRVEYDTNNYTFEIVDIYGSHHEWRDPNDPNTPAGEGVTWVGDQNNITFRDFYPGNEHLPEGGRVVVGYVNSK